MARPLRIEKVGAWYHVTACRNERKAIFRDDADRRHFLEIMAEMDRRFRLRLPLGGGPGAEGSAAVD